MSLYVERREYGPFIGRVVAVKDGDQPVATGAAGARQRCPALVEKAAADRDAIRALERDELGAVNYRIEQARLQRARARAGSAARAGTDTERRDRCDDQRGPRRCRRSTPGSKRGSWRPLRRHPGTRVDAAGGRRRREGTAGARPLPRLCRQPAVDVRTRARLREPAVGVPERRSARVEHRGRHLPGDLRHRHDGHAHERPRGAVRRPRGALPARVRAAGILRPRRAHRGQQPRRRAVDRLRRVRPRLLRLHRRRRDRPDVLSGEPADADVRHRRHPVGVADARAADGAGRHRRLRRSARRRAAVDARGVAGVRRDDVPDDHARRAAGGGARAS